MTKKQKALETIRIEVALEGKVTSHALRAYVENRVSYVAFREAIATGMKQYSSRLVSPSL